MRGLTTKLLVVVALLGLGSYLVLPGLIEDQIAKRLQTTFGMTTKPVVEVSSSFPPELLLGRIDRVQVSMDQMNLQGVPLYNARADLKDVRVSLPSLLEGRLSVQTQSCSMSVAAPALFIDQNEQCLASLGLATSW